jgi:hypothetical protein
MPPVVVWKTTRSTDPALIGELVVYSLGGLAAAQSELIMIFVHFRVGPMESTSMAPLARRRLNEDPRRCVS